MERITPARADVLFPGCIYALMSSVLNMEYPHPYWSLSFRGGKPCSDSLFYDEKSRLLEFRSREYGYWWWSSSQGSWFYMDVPRCNRSAI